MPKIIVKEDMCIRCNTCSTVCIMQIIEKATESSFPTILRDNKKKCIRCGHCESFCSTEALTLDFRVQDKIITTAADGQIDPQQLALYMKKRRSIRFFESTPVPEEIIRQLIDVATYAASAGNTQTVKWLVISGPEQVKLVAELTIEWMKSLQNTEHPLANYVALPILYWEKGRDFICHSAPHLLFAHIPFNPRSEDITDGVIAMTCFDIAAPAFGLGTCWAGFIKMAVSYYQPLRDFLALPEDRKVAYPMMFGYPKFKNVSIPRRNFADIIWK